MKRVLVFLLLLVAAPAAAEPVRLFDNVLSFDLPSAFRPMTAVEIGKKYPSQQPPQHGYTDSDTLGVTIVVTRNVNPGHTPDKLNVFGETVQRSIAGRAGITMHRRGVVSIGGADWYALDFAAQTANEPVENRLRIGVRQGYVVVFSVNATTRVFPQREAELLRVLETLKLD
jgi:hypothetical protein